MPVSPNLARDAAKEILQAYLDAELQVLQQVARRLERGIEDPGWAEAKLVELQRVKTSVAEVVLELQQGDPQRVQDAIQRMYNRGTATAATDLTRLGATIETAFATSNLATVEALAVEASTMLSQLYEPILRQTLDAYREIIATTTQLVATGATTRRQAAQQALDQFGKRGITGFVDSAGRRWDMATYAEMATRTAANRAVLAGHTERLTSYGLDLVIISDSPQECPLCRPWEGKVLSITGRTRGVVQPSPAPVDEAEAVELFRRGETALASAVGLARGDLGRAGRIAGLDEAMRAGLFHPNCTHSTSAYVPGLSRPLTGTGDLTGTHRRQPGVPSTANPEGFEARQKLRRLERGVRGWKRRQAVAITPEAKRQAQAKVQEWQLRIAEHTAFTEAKRVRAREQIGRAR